MNTKIDHEAYVRDVADQIKESISAYLAGISKNCVVCDHFNIGPDICNYHKAKPPASIIVIGCADYVNEIPFWKVNPMPDFFCYVQGLHGPSPCIYYGHLEKKQYATEKIIAAFELKPNEEDLSFSALQRMYPYPEQKEESKW